MRKISNFFKKIGIVSCIIGIFLTLSGCGNVNQLQEKLIIKGVGVDLNNDEIEITVQVFDAENSFSDEEAHNTIINSKGKTVLDAFNSLSKKTGKEALYSQNLVLIIGKKCAESGINSIMDFFIRYYEVRPSVSVFISDQDAKDMLSCEYENSLVTAEEINALSSIGRVNASGKSANVVDVVNALAGNISDPAIMALSISEDEHGKRPKSIGTAIFKEDKLVDFLDEDQSIGFMLLSDNISGGTFVMDIDTLAGKATLSFNNTCSKYSFDITDDNLKINIDICAELNLYALDNATEKRLPNSYIEKAEQNANAILSQYCKDAIQKGMQQHKTDTLNVGKRLRLYNCDFFKTIENISREKLSDAEYIVNVTSSIKNIGQEINPL